MGTALSDKDIKRAIVVACKAMKVAGERDTREERLSDEDNLGIIIPRELSPLEIKMEEEKKKLSKKKNWKVEKVEHGYSLKKAEPSIFDSDDSPF